MSNPLFNTLGGGAPQPQLPLAMRDFGQLMSKFQQFRAGYQGNPQQDVQRMLQSGKLTQQQLDQVQGLARQFMQFF